MTSAKTTRREFVKMMGLTLAAGPALSYSNRASAAGGKKLRNVIFILSDDHRYDFMSFLNTPAFLQTPNMDRMARDGAYLKYATVSTALCSPSRASILTGLYTFRHRVIDNNRLVPEGTIFFPQYLQKAGCATAFIGKWHMGSSADDPRPGFDHWVSFRGQGRYLPSPDYTLNVDGERVAQKGYIIWICDSRTASGKGLSSAWPAYRNLGEVELRDMEDMVDWLQSQPFVDDSRIGLWGWSYGGFMTIYALTHSESFRMGIAGAPVTDWTLYDSVYTERYMGLPADNREGYRKSSTIESAVGLKGRLLLIHGAMDENVHVQNTYKLADRLQRAGKQFELMIYPQSRHSIQSPRRLKHLKDLMTQFILANL